MVLVLMYLLLLDGVFVLWLHRIEQDVIFRVLSAVLTLGNTTFRETEVISRSRNEWILSIELV
jgi:myosin heavy subunit